MQRGVKELRVARGERVVGYKVGCTSPAVRANLGISEAVHGCLWDTEQYRHGSVLRASQFYRGRLGVEGELGVWVVSTTSGKGGEEKPSASVLPPAEWLVEYEPIIELHHYAFDGEPKERAFELIARNAIHAGVVHGSGAYYVQTCTHEGVAL